MGIYDMKPGVDRIIRPTTTLFLDSHEDKLRSRWSVIRPHVKHISTSDNSTNNSVDLGNQRNLPTVKKLRKGSNSQGLSQNSNILGRLRK